MKRRTRRVCAACEKQESRWPWQMFRIWAGPAHPVDLCSFECESTWLSETGGEGT